MQILNDLKKRELSAQFDRLDREELVNNVRRLEFLLQFEDMRESILYDTAVEILYLLKDSSVAKLEIIE